MAKTLFICFSLFIFVSCEKPKYIDSEVQKLLMIQKEHNNVRLGQFRDDCRFLLRVRVNRNDNWILQILERVDSLLVLNNAGTLDYGQINKYLHRVNSDPKSSCKIELDSFVIENDVAYFLALDKLIDHSCLSAGTIDRPHTFMNCTMAGSSFHVKRGDTLRIPIQAFENCFVDKYDFRLFDTLSFNAESDYSGNYLIETRNLPVGLNNGVLAVYGKDIYSKTTEIVAQFNYDVYVYE